MSKIKDRSLTRHTEAGCGFLLLASCTYRAHGCITFLMEFQTGCRKRCEESASLQLIRNRSRKPLDSTRMLKLWRFARDLKNSRPNCGQFDNIRLVVDNGG